MRSRGFRIGIVGFDQFQSNDSFVILTKEGFDCRIVRFSDSLSACNTVHEFVANKRLVFGTCDSIFIGEAAELQIVNDRRIDHLKSGGIYNSKDVWDAVVNALLLAVELSLQEGGDSLQAKDVKLYDPAELDSAEMSLVQQTYTDAELKRLQLPNNGHALIAYIYCRYNMDADSDHVSIALAAVHGRTRECKLLKLFSFKKSPVELAIFLESLEKSWAKSKTFRTRVQQSIEFFVVDESFMDNVEDTIIKKAPSIYLTRSKVELSKQTRIVALQQAAKDGKLLFPTNFTEDHNMSSGFHQLISYPFVPSEYVLLAMEGVVREADLVESPKEKTTRRTTVFTI